MGRHAFAMIWALRLWLSGICLFAFFLIARHVDAQNGWVLGDWMIDYRQGFVRRGLTGELAQALSAWLPGAAVLYTGLFVAVAWLVIGLYFARVLTAIRMPCWYVLLVLSPAGLFFSVYGADQVGRKEILLFASLAVYVWRLISGARDGLLIQMLWALWGACLVLMHEGAVFYGPYFLMAAYWGGRRKDALVSAMGLMAGMLIATLLLLALAEPLNGRALCSSLVMEGRMSASICDGTIKWPLHSIADSFNNALVTVKHFNYLAVYGLSLMLIVAPVWVWRILDRSNAGALHPPLWAFAVVWLLSLPLFLIAVDWGRFIQTHVVLATLVLALNLPRRSEHQALVAWRSLVEARWRLPVLLLTLSSYVFWNLPVCCQADIGGGLIPKIKAATHLLG